MKDLSPKILVNDANGIYIPQVFAQVYNIPSNFKNYDEVKELLDYLAEDNSPETEDYWDVWDELIDKVIMIDADGDESTLYQDGDLWEIFTDNDNSEFFGD